MIKYNLKISFMLMTTLLFMTGCGTSINLTKYSPITMNKAKNMPDAEKIMSNSLPKIIIMNVDNNGIKVAKKANLGASIASKVNTLLSNGKSVRIIKRVTKTNSNQLLSKEVAAAQLSKELGTDVGQADYIISGQLSTASYDHHFIEGYYYTIKTKDGNVRRYQSPRMNYKSCVIGNLKIFSLPSLTQDASFEFDECSRRSSEVRSSYNVVKRNDGLVREAGLESVETISYDLKNFFSKKGYVYEARLKDEDKIIKVTLGSKHGAKEGESVEIYAIEDTVNNLTGKSSKETILIGNGTISNVITSGSSWIIVNDVQAGKNINAGDFVKIKYSEDILKKAGKILGNIIR